MPTPLANFILELVAAPGVGSFALGTPVSGRLPWSAGVTAGLWASPGQVFYFANDTTKQEWGYGTYSTGTLSRDTVLGNSSGTTAKLNFATLPVYVYPEIPAERSVYRDPSTGRLIATFDIASPTQNLGPLAGFRNRLINSAFGINQRGLTSGTALSSNSYGFDRWKAGTGGCNATFTGGQVFTTVTVGAGSSLVQVIEAGNIEGGTYTLSWSGTALGRVDAGAFLASPVTVTGLAAAVSHTVEFQVGTVLKPQFEPGDVASQWEIRSPATEQQMCDRYYSQGSFDWRGYGAAGATVAMQLDLPTAMRAAPSLALVGVTNTNCGTNALTNMNNRDLKLATVVTALGSFVFTGSYTANAELYDKASPVTPMRELKGASNLERRPPMPHVSGFLHITRRGHPDNDLPAGPGGPIDPGFGVGGDGIDNELPGGVPPLGVTLPEQPPGVWPPLTLNHPWFPLPPDSAVPPGAIWPPPGGPPHPWDPIPPDASTKPPEKKIWIVAGIPGIGWRYICVDLSAKPPPPQPEPKAA